jgi:hypothetical protein
MNRCTDITRRQAPGTLGPGDHVEKQASKQHRPKKSLKSDEHVERKAKASNNRRRTYERDQIVREVADIFYNPMEDIAGGAVTRPKNFQLFPSLYFT